MRGGTILVPVGMITVKWVLVVIGSSVLPEAVTVTVECQFSTNPFCVGNQSVASAKVSVQERSMTVFAGERGANRS